MKKNSSTPKAPVRKKSSSEDKVGKVSDSEKPKRASKKVVESAATEKLQKLLARAGFGSRRALETWITEGRITLNGKLATLGDRATLSDKICVDGKPISVKRLEGPRVRVLLYNKPIGEICTRSDPEGRPTIFERMPPLEKGRWIAVGRLDINTSGLLIITSDGELANKLMHPSAQIDREYLVRVMGAVDNEMLQRLRDGVQLDDGLAKFTDVSPMHKSDDNESINNWYCCTLMEGRNREVRRLWESQGLRVSRLKRVRYGPVFLANKLPEGRWQELLPAELAILYKEAGLPVPEIAPLTPKDKEKLQRELRKPMRAARPGEKISRKTTSPKPRVRR
ncbi:MAG TPA: pseudouridine synthase [Pseudomonadales bacterium]|nr:pseudouridine synthase [Pseudomonadales bacterium]